MAEQNLVVMRHNLSAAEAGVEEVREALSYTTIHSPIDGVITQINAEVGEVVVTGMMNNPGTKILEIGWGYTGEMTTRTVDNFIVRFRKYFEENPKKPLFFKSVRSVGYLFDDGRATD